MTDDTQSTPTTTPFKTGKNWMRGLYMLLFVAIYGVAEFLVGAIILFQFGALLLTGGTNEALRRFGRQLAAFGYEIALFLTFNSDRKPYPFSPFPEGKTD